MTKIYHKTFAVSALDRERDEALSVRMAALNFIKPQHLDIPRAFQDEKSWLLAMKELHKINSYKVHSSDDPNLCFLLTWLHVTEVVNDPLQAPRDKLVCILNCCRIINNLLHVTVQQGQARGVRQSVIAVVPFASMASETCKDYHSSVLATQAQMTSCQSSSMW